MEIWIFSHPSFRGALLATLHFGSPGVQLPSWAPKKRHGKCCGLVSASVAICPSRRPAACGPEGESAPMGVKLARASWGHEDLKQGNNAPIPLTYILQIPHAFVAYYFHICATLTDFWIENWYWFWEQEGFGKSYVWSLFCWDDAPSWERSHTSGEKQLIHNKSVSWNCNMAIQHTISFRVQHSFWYLDPFFMWMIWRALLELLEYQVLFFIEDWSLRTLAASQRCLFTTGGRDSYLDSFSNQADMINHNFFLKRSCFQFYNS